MIGSHAPANPRGARLGTERHTLPGSSSRRDNLRYYGLYFTVYTMVWLTLTLFLIILFRGDGRNFFWMPDGVNQHYASFDYVIDSIRAFFSGDVSLSSLAPYNYSIGQGADILTTLGTYDYTDPISWLCTSLFFLSTTQRYFLMVFIKLWLSGAALSVFCFSIGKRDRVAVMCGSLSYVFSGALLYMFMRHPNHFNWSFFLPLMLAGVELYRRKGSRYPLILTVFFNLIVSYYTFFVDAAMLAVYVLVTSLCRVMDQRGGRAWKDELMHILRLVGLCAIGVLLSSVVLLPSAYAFTLNPRMGVLTGYSKSMLFYPFRYYRELSISIFTPYESAGYTTYIGVIPPVIIGAGVLFSQRRRNTALKAILILLAAFLCVPLVGRLFNGMGYVTNRWAFAVPMFCGVLLAETIPMMRDVSVKVRRWILIAGGAYVLYCLLNFDISLDLSTLATMGLIALCLLVWWFSFRITSKAFKAVIAVMVVACSAFNVLFTFADRTGGYLRDFGNKSLEAYVADSSSALSGKSTGDDFFRVESMELTTNIGGFSNVNSTDAWWSVLPSNYYNYMVDLEQITATQNCNFKGFDGRTALLELASVRYYTTEKKESFAPYGYRYNEELSTSKYNVYENPYALPIAYALPGYITSDEFYALPAIDRQEAMMQAAVTDEPVEGVEHIGVTASSYLLPYTVADTKKVDFTATGATASAASGTVTLNATIPENCEIYLRLNGAEIITPAAAKISVIRRSADGSYSVTKAATFTNTTNNWPVIRDGVLYNLGVGGAGENTIILKFHAKSRFTYDAVELYAVPMESYEQQAQELSRCVLENAYVDTSRISGDITLPSQRIVQFSVAYSTGFTATVDGEKVDTLVTDDLYLSVVVPAGTHHIELHYSTPYLGLGAIISLLTLAGLICWEIVRLILKKRRQKQENPRSDVNDAVPLDTSSAK